MIRKNYAVEIDRDRITALVEKPEGVNADPHNAWMIVVRVADSADQPDLLDARQYTELTQ